MEKEKKLWLAAFLEVQFSNTKMHDSQHSIEISGRRIFVLDLVVFYQ